MAHRRHHRSSKKRSKNMLNKNIGKSISFVKKFTKSTSNKYMPKIKSGLENVGNEVVKTSEQTIPYLQQMTRKLFGMFSTKTRKHRKH